MRVLFLTHRLPYAPNRGDRIRAYHMLRFLQCHAEVDVLALAHDDHEAAQGAADLPAHAVRVVRTTPWRNWLRAAALLATTRPLTHVLLDVPDL